MRIIAGKFRGRKLKSPPSLQTRPTSDRLRETLFNILARRITGARVLDLCAGTGAVGIEALSRGAARVTFVDQSRKMCALIDENLNTFNIEEHEIEIVTSEASDFLRKLMKKAKEPFDIIFFDPPYAIDHLPTLDIFGARSSSLLTAKGLVIVEHHHKNNLPEATGGLVRYRVLKQGDSALSFFEVG